MKKQEKDTKGEVHVHTWTEIAVTEMGLAGMCDGCGNVNWAQVNAQRKHARDKAKRQLREELLAEV